MSCVIAMLQGGNPEIFPIPLGLSKSLESDGLTAMVAALGVADLKTIAPTVEQFIGAARRPDGSAFYLTTLAPKIEESLDKPWSGAFFAPFGVGSISGVVSAQFGEQQSITLTVDAKLTSYQQTRVHASWSVIGSQRTVANKAALINSVTIHNSGPHSPEDMRRCLALHAPQRVFGEPRAIVAMQCGVASACLVEAIC